MTTQDSTKIDVTCLNTSELLKLFSKLEAPTLDEMEGEFNAKILKQRSPIARASAAALLYNPLWPGMWLCKAFRRANDTTGRGYNTFQHFGRVVQRFPMQTIIAPSRYDGKPAYQLIYRAYKSYCGSIHMVDEVRRLSPGVYLGIGTYGFTDRQRQAPYPFMLTGPIAAYRGDVGVERASFSLANEVPALANDA